MVAVIMSSVTFCLVLIWRREHLPDMTSDDAKEQVEDKTQQNGCLLVDVETTTDLDEM
ncbi:hypothetical protein DPMN_082726 [Dreissena polymorpha]|uniref:Uncharacterized protein n=2 Tax=Dreissena polymorpha TaxID=45954 RepID=A0A9D3YBH2_DREPO|nr:hypothetical protein DPMN_082726 [Dreissena polymorpha]